MRSRSPADAASVIAAGAVASVAPGLLGAIAEGAWVAILGAAVTAPIGGAGPAGVLVPSIIAALIGFAVARLLPGGGARTAAVMTVAIGAAAAGFLGGPALGLDAPAAPRPVGLYVVLGLAALRGAAQGDPAAGSHVIDTLVRRSPWLLGGAWAVGLLMAGAGRPWFASAAAFATLVFVIAAALALGASRMAALPPEVREQLGGNGAWLAMVGVVVGLALLVALPVAAILGQPIGSVTAAVTAGVTTATLAVAGALVTGIMVVVDAFAGLLTGVLGVSQVQPPTQPPPEVLPQQPLPPGGGGSGDSPIEPLIGIAVVMTLVVLAWLMARRMRRSAASARVPGEARHLELGDRPRLRAPRLPERLRWLRAPVDATGAYERLLTDWSAAAALARDPAETPADHAARLRGAGEGATGLDLLAADYQLARFAGVRLTPAEERRAIGRWRRLRGRAKRREARHPTA